MLKRFQKKPRPTYRQVRVNHGLCLYCGVCVGTCPANAIFLRSTHLNISEESCTSCERCLLACPMHALTIVDMQPRVIV